MPMAFHRLPVAAYTGAATITPCKLCTLLTHILLSALEVWVPMGAHVCLHAWCGQQGKENKNRNVLVLVLLGQQPLNCITHHSMQIIMQYRVELGRLWITVPGDSCEAGKDSGATSGMLWTAMAMAMTGPILVKDEKATCRQQQLSAYQLDASLQLQAYVATCDVTFC